MIVQRCSAYIRRRTRSTLCRLLNPEIHRNSSISSRGAVGFDGADGERDDRRGDRRGEHTRARFLGMEGKLSGFWIDILFIVA